uniref:Uncharacterized protein n=1 Tax=Arundo donax TaxID=35708 RepID=A0A0A9EM24_ARUDO
MPSPPAAPALGSVMTKENRAANDAVALVCATRNATGWVQSTVPALEEGTPVSRVSPTEPLRRNESPSSVRSEKDSVAESMLTFLAATASAVADAGGAVSVSSRSGKNWRTARRYEAIGGDGRRVGSWEISRGRGSGLMREAFGSTRSRGGAEHGGG